MRSLQLSGLPRLCSALLLLAAVPCLAESIPVRYQQGSNHGFLLLRDQAGKVIAVGDSLQEAHGDRVTAQLTFHFRDGSIDDERTVYTQRGVFRVVSDHHVQRGPAFPKPLNISVDAATGTVTTREPGKDGREKVKSEHLDLPPDLGNGILLALLQNIRPTEEQTSVPIVISLDGARLIHLAVKPADLETFYIGGGARKAQRFEIRVDLGGITGVVAPLIGKEPKDLQFWVLEGTAAPGFVAEEGQLYQGGPVWRIEQTSPRLR